MSSIVNNFSIFHDFPKQFKQNIKLFHVFEDYIAYCVTNDDKVYGFGQHINYFLNYNESNDNKSYVLIEELCDKRIEQFFGNKCMFFARSETNVIYSWGPNEYGQLGRGFKSSEILKPDEAVLFNNVNIIQISGGWDKCFALSSDGKVYRLGNTEFNLSSKETLIELTQLCESIKSIHCS